ncbi:MAG: DUF1272 domain-containing protein [Actinobacteria bacterium]|nr:DUF1272 domain-containing protein [Actinomycetota bacterium]
MALDMRTSCERCGRALSAGYEAFICTFECTYCPGCASELEATCPNCGGELVRRPRPAAARP